MNDSDHSSGTDRTDAVGDADSRPDWPADSDRDEAGAREIGGRKGLDPVRYGDWEKNGRCIDF